MLRKIREALETYASGMGVPAATVIAEFKKLPEAAKFEVLAKIKDLEKAHQQYVANGGKMPAPPAPETAPPPPPPSPDEQRAMDMRAEYLRTGVHPGRRASILLDRFGRPTRSN